MARKRFLFIDQEIEYGTQTIKIGFRRDILKVIDKLRVHTCDTVILEDVISIPYMSTLSLSGIKHLVIRNAGLLPHASIYGMDELETLEIYGTIGYLNSSFERGRKNIAFDVILHELYRRLRHLDVYFAAKTSRYDL